MSGGSLDYVYSRLDGVAELAADHGLNEHLAKELREFLGMVREVLHDLEWAVDGDIDIDEFEADLKRFLSDAKPLRWRD